MDIGHVFSSSFAMFRQRFWLLVGMWAVFFAIQIAGFFALGIGALVMGAGAMASGAAGIEDPAAIAGLGIGMIVFLALFYAAYLVIILAQQAALVTLASPLEEPAFGAALSRGFKSALPFFGIAVILMLGYFVVFGGIGAMVGAASGGNTVVQTVVGLAFLPVLTYFACRFAVLVPVVAVDRVFNPIAAIRRSWAVTRGKVLSILLAFVGFLLISLVVLGAPVAVLVTTVNLGDPNSAGAAGVVLIAFLAFFPLFIVYSVYAAAFAAAMHNEVTGGGAESLEEVFA